MRFSKVMIQEIKSKVDIVEVAKFYFTDLVISGIGTFKASCCFHHDHDPSLTIYQNTQSFYCFGCKKSGDVFDLVAHFEKIDFQQAVNFVANKYNIRFETTGSSQIDYSYDSLVSLNSSIEAKKYIYQRGLNTDFLESYGVKYNKKLKAIAFPIYDKHNKPIYYFYRCISPYGLRYLIPPQVEKKCFNFIRAIKEIQSEEIKALYVFEGVFDCLAFLQLHQEEKVTAIALCGLSSSDLSIIETFLKQVTTMYDSRIVFCLDNDDSGKATQLELAIKAIKEHYPRNYFYIGNYNNHKDYASTLEEDNFIDTISSEYFLSSLDYLLNYYGYDQYKYDNDLLESINNDGRL